MHIKTSSLKHASIWNIVSLQDWSLGSKIRSWSLVLGTALTVSGCGAEFNSIYRQKEVGNDDLLISQDAKQRVILRVRRPVSEYGQAQWVTCVEPPPDFASVLAAAASGTFSSPSGVAAGLAGSSAESGGTIGLRTQSIQLLRDSAYRICEGFANAAVSGLDYAQLLRRNQVMLTAVLAIEQLTGAVTGPALAVGASGSTEVDQEAVKNAEKVLQDRIAAVGVEQGKVNAADTKKQSKLVEIKATEEEIVRLEGIISSSTASAADKATAETNLKVARTTLEKKNGELTTIQAELAQAQGSLGGAENAVKEARNALTLARQPGATTQTAQQVTPSSVVSKDIPQVANAVRDIVGMAFAKQHILDLCQMYWSGLIEHPLEVNRPAGSQQAYMNLDTACDGVLTSWLTTISKADADGAAAATRANTDLGLFNSFSIDPQP